MSGKVSKSCSRRLPPILTLPTTPTSGIPVTSNRRQVKVAPPSPSTLYPAPTSGSKYHRDCCRSPVPGCSPGRLSPAPYHPEPTTPRGLNSSRPRLRSPLPASDTGRREVNDFLAQNLDFLESYVMNNVDIELIERWVIRKNRINVKRAQSAGDNSNANGKGGRKTSLSRWKFCVHADKRKMLQELTNSLYLRPNKGHVLTELAGTIASAVNADNWNLLVYDHTTQQIKSLGSAEKSTFSYANWEEILKNAFESEIWGQQSSEGTKTLAEFVAHTREPVRHRIGEHSDSFPLGVPTAPDNAEYVLNHPILEADGSLTGILELFRKKGTSMFHEEDEEIVNSYLVWGGIALHYAELYMSMASQRKLHSFLLTVVKSIFQDMVSMDAVIVKIMTFAQKLVNADRASLFLVDGRTKELYARIFDVSAEDGSENGLNIEATKEIRFPIGTGIAGFVAQTGEALNICDCYNDERFNKQVDNLTGYTTKNLLCMPIFIRGSVIGVVQMVNKINGIFTKSDEESFATFAIYCGLALHHARLYDKIRRSEQKYKVAIEILSYHNTGSDEELEAMKDVPVKLHPDLDQYHFSPYGLSSDDKVTQSIAMFHDLFGPHNFDLDSLYRFGLTVRKNYRRVPYHNWAHGFSVANAVYVVIKKSRGLFRSLEELSLLVSCLCHDLDHRGKTNQFLINFASPLAAMYSTSVLEHHHFNQTIAILQDGHNILKNLTSDEYRQVLGNIKHCILATDLALFFPNMAKLKGLLAEATFDDNIPQHRLLLQAITMTACDLVASTKPWEQQKETVRVIFEEFYEQGDAERAQGREPIPMMDRNQHDEQPASQVGFLKGICVPCYALLAQVVPETSSLLANCLKNLEKWEQIVEEKKAKKLKSENESDVPLN